jgi:HAD superfamily hydrolase (TIGR01450 family)
MAVIPSISRAAILSEYEVVLLDAYGVLVDDQGPLPGALDFLHQLHVQDKRFLILTNSASRLPEKIAEDLRSMGFPVRAQHILSSGQLLGSYFARHGLLDTACLVLGTADSVSYVERAGGHSIPLPKVIDAEVLVIADQAGFDCLAGMNQALNLLIRRIERGKSMHLLLCNPDLVYPVDADRLGFTAGALAAMLEAVLRERYPGSQMAFVRLGKPHTLLFEEALRRSGGGRAVMLGDQLATDILGANRAGIDSVWVGTGLGIQGGAQSGMQPSWYLPNLS